MEKIPAEYTKFFTSPKDEFQKEVKFLFDSKECLSRLLAIIETEKKEFQECLAVIKPIEKKPDAEEFIKEQEKGTKLINTTSAFFQQKAPTQWKEYPQNLVAQSPTYAGHHIKFFTLPQNDPAAQQQASEFANHLIKEGFSAEQRNAKGKPSIIVDLTTSSLTM